MAEPKTKRKKTKPQYDVRIGDAELAGQVKVPLPDAWRYDESGGPQAEHVEEHAKGTFWPTDLAGGGVGMGYGKVRPVSSTDGAGFDSVLLPNGEIAYVPRQRPAKDGAMERTVPFSNAPEPGWDVSIDEASLDPGVTVEIGEPVMAQDDVLSYMGDPVIQRPKKKAKKKVAR